VIWQGRIEKELANKQRHSDMLACETYVYYIYYVWSCGVPVVLSRATGTRAGLRPGVGVWVIRARSCVVNAMCTKILPDLVSTLPWTGLSPSPIVPWHLQAGCPGMGIELDRSFPLLQATAKAIVLAGAGRPRIRSDGLTRSCSWIYTFSLFFFLWVTASGGLRTTGN